MELLLNDMIYYKDVVKAAYHRFAIRTQGHESVSSHELVYVEET